MQTNEAQPLWLSETYVRGRKRHHFIDLLMAGLLLASRKVFIGLDDGAQACLRIPKTMITTDALLPSTSCKS
jgi:hypothetical protein